MDEKRHTTGDWFIDADMVEHCCHQSAVCAEVQNGDGMYGKGIEIVAEVWGNKNYEANARLISAAPDMLEALKLFVHEYAELVESGDAGFWDVEKEEKVIKARAAIAKAEGSS